MDITKISWTICAVSITALTFSGCSKSTESTGSSAEEEPVVLQVTEIEDNKVTGDTGTITENTPEAPPENKSKETPPENRDDTPPEKPAESQEEPPNNGENTENTGEELPQKPQGQKPSSGKTFESDGDTISFEIDDETQIIVEFLQGEGEGTIDDIAVGSVLEVSLEDDNTASEITVKNLNAGSGFGGSSEVTNGTSANTITEDTSISDKTYTSSGDDENALRVDGAEVSLDNVTIEKTAGNSSNTENGDFYGQNAAFLALNGSIVNISNSTVTTNAVNGNGVFSYGEGTVVNISDSTIKTTNNNSGGIQTTGGGTTNASNLNIETSGNSSAAIRSDRGGGTVNVDGGTYVTNGLGSPAIYSTADITVENADLMANNSEGIVVEGKNSVNLVNCTLAGNMKQSTSGDEDDNLHAIMIYQSMSGDADLGEAYFSANGGSITSLSGDLFYITNTNCQIDLENVTFTTENGVFLRAAGNNSSRGWGTEGTNGGNVILSTSNQTIEGDIIVDSISSLEFSMGQGTTFIGAINQNNDGGNVDVILEDGANWTLTGNTYITSFEGDLSSIITNGHSLYVDGNKVL